MATIVGESGAWRAIIDELARFGHSVSRPHELAPLLVELQNSRPGLIAAYQARTTRDIQEIEKAIDALRADQRFFRGLLNWFKIRRLKANATALLKSSSSYPSTVEKPIVRIRELMNSAELAGANAELSVIQNLRALPSSVFVFNDVRLGATRRIQFDGATLQSAQIDHVVLTPAGVFIVETKHWSRQFIESGNFFDPFRQINRASYLCHDLLRRGFGKTRVRSVLVCSGAWLDPPKESYIKVLRPEGLAGYISAFRNSELTSERFSDLRNFFEERVGRQRDFPPLTEFAPFPRPFAFYSRRYRRYYTKGRFW